MSDGIDAAAGGGGDGHSYDSINNHTTTPATMPRWCPILFVISSLILFVRRTLAAVLLLGDLQFTADGQGNPMSYLLCCSQLRCETVTLLLGHAVVADPSKLRGIAAALGIQDSDLNRVFTTKTFSARCLGSIKSELFSLFQL